MISVLRGDEGFVPTADTVLEAGDEILAVLDPNIEEDLTAFFGAGLRIVREVDFLLVGGGMGSAYCASELRRRGADGSVLLVGREQDPPYERPPLSKEYLRGDAKREDAIVQPARSGTRRTRSSS